MPKTMSRRVCSSGWWRRWRGIVWCCLCLVCLALLAIWDTLGYLLASSGDQRTRYCPPPPVEVDGCASWRPLQVPHPTCACTRKLLVLHDTCADFVATDISSYMIYTREYYGNSHCSDQATLRGPRQHVVSLSIEKMTPQDLLALNQTVNQINSVYKGWVVRVHARAENHSHPDLCSIVCNNPNIDLCDVKGMSKPSTQTSPQARIGWQWAVLGDPLVSVWLTRYLELEILEREAHAVTQFINSDKCWHLMKDHQSQTTPIGSGLLGGKTAWGSRRLRRIRSRLTNGVQSIADEETIIEDSLIPLMDNDVMTHDSVTCHKTTESVPYPSRRHPGQWVGMPSAYKWHELQLSKTQTHMEASRQTVNVTKKPLLLQKLAKRADSQSAPTKSNSADSSESIESQKESGFVQNQNSHVQDKTQKSKSEHKIQSNSFPHTTNASKRVSKVPNHVDLSNEGEINQKNGIVECPQACRPHHHPDWQFC